VKKIAIIPTLLTLGNAVCGFAAIAYAGKIGLADATAASDSYYLALSGWLIVVAMLFDSLDGYVARLARSTSKFGAELDSLCDAISFGAAPAFLLLRLGQDWEMPVVQQALAVIAVLYVICAVLRLARFNVDNSPDPASHKRFKGLPSPAAAGCLASLALLRGSQASHALMLDSPLLRDWLKLWTPLGALVVASLMVSRLSYPHLTKQLLRGRRHFSHLIRIIMAVCLLALLREWALLLVFWGYALTFPMRYALARGRRRLPQPAGLDDAWPR